MCVRFFPALLMFFLLASAASAQEPHAAPPPDGETPPAEVALPAFERIKADGQVILEVTVGAPAQTVTVETRGGTRDDLALRVKGNTLRVREDSQVDERRGRPLYLIRIEVPRLTAVNVGAGSRTEVTGVDAERFEVRTTTGAALMLAGRCGELALSVNTGGVIDAEALRCQRARARANTGGVARLHASVAVDAGANTGGEIDVYGSPAAVDKGSWLGGDVSLRNEGS